jgi:hypothetical protein
LGRVGEFASINSIAPVSPVLLFCCPRTRHGRSIGSRARGCEREAGMRARGPRALAASSTLNGDSPSAGPAYRSARWPREAVPARRRQLCHSCRVGRYRTVHRVSMQSGYCCRVWCFISTRSCFNYAGGAGASLLPRCGTGRASAAREARRADEQECEDGRRAPYRSSVHCSR